MRFVLLFSMQSSDYSAATVAKVSLYSACMETTVSFGSDRDAYDVCFEFFVHFSGSSE